MEGRVSQDFRSNDKRAMSCLYPVHRGAKQQRADRQRLEDMGMSHLECCFTSTDE